ARLAKITYDEDAPILTLEDALAVDSRFEDAPRVYEKGDAVAILQKATHRLKGQIDIGGQEHFYLEGQAALSSPQENGDVFVQSSTQHPTEIQHKVADAIGKPMHAVRVEMRRMGGGFGGKESQGNALAVATAIAALRRNRPAKMRYDRDDDMIITGKRHDFRIDYDVAFDADGKIEAVDFTQYCRCGWAQDLSIPVADRAMLHADNAYNLPHARITSHRLKTNTQSATAYRGFGGPQGILGIERVMDHIAHHLDRDPYDIRRINFYKNGDTTPYHMDISDSVIDDLSAQLVKDADYKKRRRDIADWNAKNPILKRGISLTPVKFGISFTLTHLNQAGALVHIYQDGSIHLNHGGAEMGQGLYQKLAQVAAEVFQVPMHRIRITAADTDKVPNTSATAASSGADLNGMAVKIACETLKDRITAFLANTQAVADDEIRFQGDSVHIGAQKMPFEAAIKAAYENRVSLSATGFYKTPDITWDRLKGRGRPFYYFAYGAAITEVVIDTLTGENRILRTDILHDAGRSLNPALDIGQIEGAYVQGAGWLTTEELIWDDKGALKTHAPSTYKIPACSDRPDIFNVALYDNANPVDTVYRSKAVGEPPFNLGMSAFFALSDAVSNCGSSYPDLNAPATAERVFNACDDLS
ncbi:MAG: xanthine dehydrogenase molybdopterin binding subunit, partial [Halocynthiibacter sp.]